MPRKIFLFLVSTLLLPALTYAQEATPQITVSGQTTIPVAIAPFTGPQGPQATKLLQTCLNLSSLFRIVPQNEATFLISGRTTEQGVTGSVRDLSKGANVLEQSFDGGWRTGTQRLGNAILEKLTGVPGFFTNKVAFVSALSTGPKPVKEIFIMDIDGGNVRQLTNDGVLALGPKFSKDGQRIAFVSYKSGYPDVWVIDLAEGNKRRVSFFPGTNFSPAFSPDGSTIALVLSKDGNTELYTIGSQGGSPNRLTRTRGTESTPTWSPDGQQIAFVSDDRGTPQLFLIPAGGGTPNPIRTNSTYATEPDWSPDGKAIAFSTRAAGQSQIASVSPRSGEVRLLTETGGAETPSWTSNSRHLVHARGGKLHVLDTVTRRSVPIENGVSANSEPTVSRQ
jgi:TolB protein